MARQYLEIRADDFACTQAQSKEHLEQFAFDFEEDEKKIEEELKKQYGSLCNSLFMRSVVRFLKDPYHPSGYVRTEKIRENLKKRFGEQEKAI